MTSRKPPSGGPPQRFESYRPAQERAEERTERRSGPPRPGQSDTYRTGPPAMRSDPYDGPQSQGRPAPRPPQQAYPPRGGYGEAGRAYAPAHAGSDDRDGSSLPRLALMVVGLAVVVVGALAFAGSWLSVDFVRDRLVAAVKQRTGRDLVISGPTSFSLFPSAGVRLEQVTLSGPPGSVGARPLATMASIDVAVSVLPLLQREVRIKRLVLREPTFNLEVDGNGLRSWDFAAVSEARPGLVRLAQLATTTATATSDAPGGLSSDVTPASIPSRGPSTARLSQLSLDDVRIDNGTIRYADARSGAAHEMKSVNVELAVPGISEPMTAKGNLIWNLKPVDFDGVLTSVASLIEDRPAKLKLALNSEPMQSTFEGTVSVRDAVDGEGILSLQTPSVRTLARWFGTELPPSQGFGALTAKGLLRSSGKTATFGSAEISLDGAVARGDIAVESGGARPHVKANLKLTEINLNTYKHTAADEGGAAVPSPTKGTTDASSAQSIDDLLEREPQPPNPRVNGPRVKGFTQRAGGWSDEPIDLALLGLVDADAKLSVARLLVRDIKVGQSELTVALKNRVMKTTVDDVRLYDGRGRGFVTIDGAQPGTAGFSANMSLEGVSAQPLLKDAADIDRIAGKGRLAFALAGQGETERQLVGTLNGKVEFAFADGAIIGVNIPQMIRGFGAGGSGGAEKTDFSEASSTWSVTNGVAQNQDLKVVSPLMRLAGSGSVTLPSREIDYMLRPKVVASLVGQGGEQNANGFEIPVRVYGTWDDVQVKPDFKGVLKDPNKAVDTLKEIGKEFKGKSANDIVKGLLGKGDGTDGSGDNGNAKKLLQQFLQR